MFPVESVRESKVGVVIPAYNAARYLQACLKSVASQTFTNLEVHVVSDGSTDATEQIAREFGDPRLHLHVQANQGVAAARNRGLRELSPEVDFVLFLDADDLILPDALELLVGAARSRADAVGAVGYSDVVFDLAVTDEASFPWRHPKEHERKQLTIKGLEPAPPGHLVTLKVALAKLPFAIGSTLVRRQLLDEVGGFHGLRAAEDWLLWMRCCMRGPFVPVNQVVHQYRRHDENVSSDGVLMAAEAKKAHAAVMEELGRTHPEVARIYSLHLLRDHRRFRDEASGAAPKARRALGYWKRLLAHGRRFGFGSLRDL